jgi:hypothetical protein
VRIFVDSNLCLDMSKNMESVIVKSEPSDMATKPDLAHIKLVRHDEVKTKIPHDISVWSIKMDPAMSLSHAKCKIAELTCLKSI